MGEYAGIALLHISEGNKEKKGITIASNGPKKYVPIKNVPIGSYVVEPAKGGEMDKYEVLFYITLFILYLFIIWLLVK